MVNYTCNTCDYSTGHKANYSKHLLTKKHIEKVNKELIVTTIPQNSQKKLVFSENSSINKSDKESQFICEFCNKKLSRKDNYTRHLSICKQKIQFDSQIEKNNKIITLEKALLEKDKDHQIELLKKEVEQKEFLMKELEKKEKDIEYYKDTLSAAGNMVQKSFSALTDIMNTHYNAPPIDCIKYVNFKTIKNYEDDDDMVIDILRSHDNNGLAKYIGKSILDIYKKDSPSDQSVWTTDTSRLTYVLKKFIDEDDSRWVVDKKGIETQKMIIDPLIKKIADLTTKYYEDNAKNVNLADMSRKEMEKVIEISEKYQSFMADIRTGKLHTEILKFMAPHLSYKKKKQLELCDE